MTAKQEDAIVCSLWANLGEALSQKRAIKMQLREERLVIGLKVFPSRRTPRAICPPHNSCVPLPPPQINKKNLKFSIFIFVDHDKNSFKYFFQSLHGIG